MQPSYSSIPFVACPVSDAAKARAFYIDVLGLVEVANWQDQWIEFGLPGVEGPVVAVTTAMEGSIPGAKGATIALETEDFDGVVAHLKERGVAFLFGPVDTGVCHFARFEDPDGNPFILHKRHAK